MKKLLIAFLILIPFVGNAQALKFDSGVVYDGSGFKLAATTPLYPLTKDNKWWFEAVAAMKPDSNEQLWVGCGVSYNFKFQTGFVTSLRAGFTSNVLRESINKTQALAYVGVGVRF